jgi:AcrR family transcriptional regulator
MPLARFEHLEAERRRRLLVAAAHEFAAEGYEGASLAAIAEEAGISKPAVYYYFEDKADLYATVVREAWARLTPEDQIDIERLDARSFWLALETHHEGAFRRSREEPWLLALWKVAYHPPADPAAAAALADVLAAGQAFFRSLLRRGQQLGLVRTDLPEEFLIAMVTACDQAADHWLVDHWDELGGEEVYRLSRCVLEMLRASLAPPSKVRSKRS